MTAFDLEERLRRYGDTLDDALQERPVSDYVPPAAYSTAADETTTPPRRKRRMGVVAAVAAASLLVVGAAVVVSDRGSNDVVTDSDSSSGVADTVSPPGQADPVLSTGVVDALGYRWTRVPSDGTVLGGEGTQWMEGVTVGGPGLVAVGSDGSSAAVWTSADGTAWDRVPHNESVFGGSEEISMLSVTAGGPGLVAVGYEGRRFGEPGPRSAVWTSADGLAWSRVPNDGSVFGNTWMKAVTAGGPGLVAVGVEESGAAVWTSVDGLSWSRVPQDTAIFGFPGGQGFGMTGVTEGGPGLVAVGLPDGPDGARTATWTSIDGITWSRVPDSTGPWPDGFLPWGVTAGGPGLVAVGYSDVNEDADAVVWTSADGLTWSEVPNNDGIFGGPGDVLMSMNSVTSTSEGLVAVGFGGEFGCCNPGSGPGGSKRQQPGEGPLTSASAAVWTSVDGLTWARLPHDDAVFGAADGRWTGITSVTDFGPGVVAVGADKVGGDVDAAVWVATLEN